MTDTPNSATPSAGPARRPWTILGRLTEAVREQNWFAVVLEVVIVVLGVVIGFQATGWGQERADRAKEQEYLQQLAEDLRETERRVAEADSLHRPFEHATGALMRAFYAPTRPSRDSLLAWLFWSANYEEYRAVTGTIEALIATGDLALIRNDSLRSALTGYLGVVDAAHEDADDRDREQYEASVALRATRDHVEEWAVGVDLIGNPETDRLYPLPDGPPRRLAPLDVDAFLSDLSMESAAVRLMAVQVNLRGWRSALRDQNVALREQVEAEIEP